MYYRRFKKDAPHLKVTALFDPSIDNTDEGQLAKEDGLVELITDYNARYGREFRIQSFALMKKDIAARLAHKEPYQYIAREPEQQIDILIVVDQMLTGYDSKWINTLYMDKVLRGANIIQAFSRTNRFFGPDKPFGTIRYYRFPHTMRRLVSEAIKEYSGDRPIGLFVPKLGHNLLELNRVFQEIQVLFQHAGEPEQWLRRLIPDLRVCDMTRINYQKLLNDYAAFHERQTTMDFHHQLKAAIQCTASNALPLFA